MDAQLWSVLLHDDEINSVEGLVYVLREVYGLPVERGLAVAADIQAAGQTVLADCGSVYEAETLVAALQLRGFRASVRENGRG